MDREAWKVYQHCPLGQEGFEVLQAAAGERSSDRSHHRRAQADEESFKVTTKNTEIADAEQVFHARGISSFDILVEDLTAHPSRSLASLIAPLKRMIGHDFKARRKVASKDLCQVLYYL